jgi:hypothetical protein
LDTAGHFSLIADLFPRSGAKGGKPAASGHLANFHYNGKGPLGKYKTYLLLKINFCVSWKDNPLSGHK